MGQVLKNSSIRDAEKSETPLFSNFLPDQISSLPLSQQRDHKRLLSQGYLQNVWGHNDQSNY